MKNDTSPIKRSLFPNLRRKKSIFIMVVFSVLLAAAALFLFTRKSKELKQEFASQQEVSELKDAFTRLNLYLQDVELADREFALSGNMAFLKNMESLIDSLLSTYGQIQRLQNRQVHIADTALFLKSDSLFDDKISFIQQLKTFRNDNNHAAAIALLQTRRGIVLADSIRQINSRFITNLEKQAAASRVLLQKSVAQNQGIGFGVISVSVLLIGIIFYFLFKEIQYNQNVSEELRIRKDHFRVTLSSLGEGLITTDKEGHVVYMNPAAEKLTGWNWQEAKHQPLKNVYEVVNETNGLHGEDMVSRMVRKGEKIELENNTILKARDGRQYIISNNGAPLYDLHGNITGAVVVFNDITEKREREQKLIQSEEKFRTVVQQAAEGILIVDQEGNYLDANESASRITGYSIEEFKQLNAKDIVDPDDLKKKPLKLEETIAGKAVYEERVILRKDKTKVEVEISAKLIENGTVVCVMRDITERKRAQEMIQREKELSDKIINSLPGVFYFYDETLRLLRWNKQLEIVTGYSSEELSTMNPADLFTGDDKKYMQGKSRHVFANGSGNAEACFTTKSGKKIPFYFTGMRMKYEGRNALLGIGIDISERKKAEEEMRLAIERFNLLSRATHDTIWDWDIQHDTMIYNEGMMRMFGYTASDIAQAVDWWKNNIHPEDRERIAGMLNDVFEHKTETIQMEYRYRGADGTYKHILDRALVLYDTTGNPLRMIGAMQDISWQKDEELRMGKRVIDAQERERRQIGMELHDNVNQILGASLIYLSMASNEAKSKNEIFDTINQTSGFIKDAIAEIRRLSHQLAPASFKNVSLKEVFESLVLSMNSQKNWAVQIRFDASYHNEIREDVKINLYRILQEQLNNIHKYARADKVEISVRVIENSIQLHVEDNGVGFNPKTIKRGIGLENISRRTEVFNGRMQLRSAPGQGCKLLVEIPLEAN